MKKINREYWEKEIDQWLEEIEPIAKQNAPAGFAQKILALTSGAISVTANDTVSSRYFWRGMAAGIAVLMALNLYTIVSFRQSEQRTEQLSGAESIDYQLADADTYNNYSLLITEDGN